MNPSTHRIAQTISLAVLGAGLAVLGATVATAAGSPPPLYACYAQADDGEPRGALEVVADPGSCADRNRVAVALARQDSIDLLLTEIASLQAQVDENADLIEALDSQVGTHTIQLGVVEEDAQTALTSAQEAQADLEGFQFETEELATSVDEAWTVLDEVTGETDDLWAAIEAVDEKADRALARATHASAVAIAARNAAQDAMDRADAAIARGTAALARANDAHAQAEDAWNLADQAHRAAQVALNRANTAHGRADDAHDLAGVAINRATIALNEAARAHQRIDELEGS